MAATGLLGVNPYGGGTVLDLSSKPTNLAIQLHQREQAKNEALDKYFMDYDKNINPAGMRNVDIDDLMKMQQAAKQYFFENKNAIKKPELDNGKAYANFLSMNKQMLGHVAQSKEEAAKAKVLTQAVSNAKSRKEIIDDDVFQGIANSQYSLKDPRFQSFDVANFNTYKPHDPLEYQQKIYTRIPLSESKPEMMQGDKPGWFYQQTKSAVSPGSLPAIRNEAYTNYEQNKGFKKFIDNLDEDKIKVLGLDEVYRKYSGGNKLPRTPQDVAFAYTLSLAPEKTTTTNQVEMPEYRRQRNKAYSNAGATDPLTYLNQGLNVLGSKNEEAANNYFSNWKRQAKFSLGGDQIGFKDIKFIPGTDDFKVNYTIDVNKVAVPQSQQFNLKDPQLLAKLISLHQNFLGSDVKLEKSQNAAPIPTPKPGKPETLAERMRRLKNQK